MTETPEKKKKTQIPRTENARTGTQGPGEELR